jgi:1,4-dihydroxy-2-naphthoate octaprenyltransferase
LLIGSYVAATIFALVGLLPLTALAVWLTFPFAFTNVRSVLTATERRAFVVGIKKTALLHLVFGLVLALAIVFNPNY